MNCPTPAPVPPTIGRVRFDVVKSLWLWALLLPGAWGAATCLDLRLTAVSLILTGLCLCLGHSVGLHRGIIHRTYRTSRLMRGCLAWLFVQSGLGGPLTWAKLHAVRDHWQNQADCPPYFAYRHELLRDFWWNLHCRFEPADDQALARLPADVLRDPWLRFLEATWPLHVAGAALLLGWWGGPAAIAVCACARCAAAILGHWFVGYAAHAWGEARYHVHGACESGTNHWLLGVASFGEGFHNNHHAFPGSARIGLRWWEFDLGWWAVRALRCAGLISNVQAGAGPETMAGRGVEIIGTPRDVLTHHHIGHRT